MISIVVVNYKTLQITLDALHSVVDFTQGTAYELIVIDNASGEQEFLALQAACNSLRDEGVVIHLIGNDTNVGFGRANNQGFDLAMGEFIAS